MADESQEDGMERYQNANSEADEAATSFVCALCGKKLSRKQRVISHMRAIHNIQSDHRTYKRYLMDPEVPIPKRTLYRFKSTNGSSHAYGTEPWSSTSAEAICSPCRPPAQSTTEQGVLFPASSSDEPVVNLQDENSFDTEDRLNFDIADLPGHQSKSLEYLEMYEFAAEDLETCEFAATLDTSSSKERAADGNDKNSEHSWEYDDSSSDSSICSSSMDKFMSDNSSESECELDGTPDATYMPETEQRKLAIISFIIKYNLSGRAGDDLIEMLKTLNVDDVDGMTLSGLKNSLETSEAEIYDICENCGALYPQAESVRNCIKDGCAGVLLSKNKKRKSYFACLCIKDQLISVLTKENNWQNIIQYTAECQKRNTICDVLSGELYKKIITSAATGNDNFCLSLMFNTDGVPLYSSSGISIWPVFLVVNELPPKMRFSKKNMILWGVWQGKGKPKFQTYFIPFLKEIIALRDDGIFFTIGDQSLHAKVVLLCGTMDLQAKALVAEMTAHNGLYGCITCEEPGEVVKQGRGHTRVFPYREEPAPMRTKEDFFESAFQASETGVPNKGIKNLSSLHGMGWFDIVAGLVPDYMHGILLGVTKKLLNLLLASCNSKQVFFIGNHIKVIDKHLTSMRPNDCVFRLPRKMENNLGHFKASEYQTWLLFYSLPCLSGIMKAEYLDHLAMLIEGIYILLGDDITEGNLERASLMLNEFYSLFGELYGKNNCSLNIHNITHLVWYVRNLGPLWAWSCFPFENMNGTVLAGVHGTGDVCQQILWSIQAVKVIDFDSAFISNSSIKSYVSNMTNVGQKVRIKFETKNCKIAGGLSSFVPSDLMSEKVRTILNLPDVNNLGKISKVLRIINGDTVFFSKEYTRMVKRLSYVVMVKGVDDCEFAEIQYFLLHHDTNMTLAVLKKISINPRAPQLHPYVTHIVNVYETSEIEHVIFAHDVVEKVLYLCGKSNVKCIARMPNMYGLCS